MIPVLRQAEPTEAEALPLQQRAQGIAEALPALARLSGSVVTWQKRSEGQDHHPNVAYRQIII